MVNEGGSIEGGMLGEYISLYDTNSDSEHPSTVPESHTNTDPRPPTSATKNNEDQETRRTQVKKNRLQSKSKSKAKLQNTTESSVPVQNAQQQTTGQDSNSAQIIYVPVYTQSPQNQQVVPPLINGQYQNPSYVQQPNVQYQYVQAPQQQQVVYVQAPPQQPSQQQQQVMYVQQPVQQAQQPQYIQQPVQYQQPIQYQQPMYIQTAPAAPSQMSNFVGMGMNQVPTLMY